MRSPTQRGFVLAATLATFLTPPAALSDNVPYLVKDINSGWMGSAPTSMTKVGDRLFFNADDGVHGQELWVTDGAESGTYIVIDLVPGADGSVPQWYMADLNGIAIFYADNNDDGFDLYRSDGTQPGTNWIGEVTDNGDPIPEGSCTFSFYYFEHAEGTVFFMGEDEALNREALWKTDGTVEGTLKLKELNINEMLAVGSTLFFVGSGSGQTLAGFDIWKSDGTVNGTIRLADLGGAIRLTESNGRVFFEGEGQQGNEELWVTDATVGGTTIVKDINPGLNPSTPFELTDVNGTLYFTAFAPGFGREIWKSDGTESGTQMVLDLVAGSGSCGAYGLTNVDGTLFFARFDSIQGWQLWKSNGTLEGTELVRTIAPTSVTSKTAPSLFLSVNGKLYFRADDGEHGYELWVSDGTSGGTRMIADIVPGTAHHWPGDLYAVGPIIFYGGGDELRGQELWAFDTRDPAIPALSPYGLAILASALTTAGCIVVGRFKKTNELSH